MNLERSEAKKREDDSAKGGKVGNALYNECEYRVIAVKKTGAGKSVNTVGAVL